MTLFASSLGADPTAAKEILKKSTLCPPPVKLYKMLQANVHVLYGELLDTGRYTFFYKLTLLPHMHASQVQETAI